MVGLELKGSTDTERQIQKSLQAEQKIERLNKTREAALGKIARAEYAEGIELSVETLHQALELYEKNSIELVPCYLALADAHLGALKLKQTEEFLSLANWNIVKDGTAQDEYRGRLHLVYGKLYIVQQKPDEALHQLANAIYHLSTAFGPEHVESSLGYFHLGTAFQAANRMDHGLAMFDKVVDIWYKFLSGIRVMEEQSQERVDQIQSYLAVEVFKRIIDARVRVLGPEHIATGEARYTLGLLYLYLGCHEDAEKQVNIALTIYREQLGDGHPSTIDVESVSVQFQQTNDD